MITCSILLNYTCFVIRYSSLLNPTMLYCTLLQYRVRVRPLTLTLALTLTLTLTKRVYCQFSFSPVPNKFKFRSSPVPTKFQYKSTKVALQFWLSYIVQFSSRSVLVQFQSCSSVVSVLLQSSYIIVHAVSPMELQSLENSKI